MSKTHMRFAFLLMVFLTIGHTAGAQASEQHQLTFSDARHLLNRTGFGADPASLIHYTSLTREQAITQILDGLVLSSQRPLPRWTRAGAPHHFARRDMERVQRREFNEAREQEMNSLRQWWVREMIETPYPQTERLVLFWHNHFTSAFTAVGDQSISMARQHITIRRNAAGNLRSFLKAMIRDPALLNYLDNNNSKKSAPNENLARELLELFTLGEGHYSEADVKNVARALTGYSYNNLHDLQFTFRKNQHDTGIKTVFGQQGNFDGDAVIDLILAQPQAARFIALKLWHWMVSSTPPSPQQLESLAASFRNDNYNIKTLYGAILRSEEFWQATNRNSLIKSPVSLLVGTIRSTGIVPANWQTVTTELKQLGQHLFEPPNVAGWPGGRNWVTPARLLNRLEWLRGFSDATTSTSENIMTSNMMAPNMMDNSISMEGNNSGNVMTARNTLTVTMAAEEFDGPVQYQVNVLNDDAILWSSGKRSLQGGVDTKRFGRVKGIQNLPWQNVHFSLPPPATRFSSIEIRFLNNKQNDGNDRNLYVRSAVFGERQYLAADGQQENQCPRQKRSKGGRLLCNGSLRLTKSAAPPSTAAPANNTLQVSGVYLRKVPNANNTAKRPTMSLVLTDTHFGERQWQTMQLSLQHLPNKGRYQLVLNQSDCWPHCFTSWPKCNKQNKQTQRWALRLTRNYRKQCRYEQLDTRDKQFINAIIYLLPQLYNATADNKILTRPGFLENYHTWAPHIDSASTTAAALPAVSPTLTIVPTKPLAMPPTPDNTPIKVGGRTIAEFNADLAQALSLAGSLTTLLLNHADTPDVDSTELAPVLTNLHYQLH